MNTETELHDVKVKSRRSRAQESRAAEPVHESYDDVDWEPKGLLDTTHIPARPGYVQRWVRTEINGQPDPNNVGRRINQGWRPRMADSVPQGSFVPTVVHQGSNVVGIIGMILMERPEAMHNQHRAHIRAMTDAQDQAVNQNLFRVHERNSGFGRPTVDAKSRVSQGRIAPIADD